MDEATFYHREIINVVKTSEGVETNEVMLKKVDISFFPLDQTFSKSITKATVRDDLTVGVKNLSMTLIEAETMRL